MFLDKVIIYGIIVGITLGVTIGVIIPLVPDESSNRSQQEAEELIEEMAIQAEKCLQLYHPATQEHRDCIRAVTAMANP